MRVGLPVMLALSFALHIGLAAGLFFSFAPGHGVDSPPSGASGSSLVLMETPKVETVLPMAVSPLKTTSVSSSPTTSLDQRGQTPPPVSVPVNEAPVPAPVASFIPSPESNPNAHTAAPKTESLLSPAPPPRLDGREAVVFMLDISGSMYEPYAGSTRLALARQSLAKRLRSLKDGAPFALTVYAQTARNSGPLVAANAATREAAVRFIMQDYDCGGGTNLPNGLASAEQLKPGNIVLATDGDLNMAPSDLLSATHRTLGDMGRGPFLTIEGICPRPGTGDGRILRALTDQQGGAYLAETLGGNASPMLTSAKADAPAAQ